MDRALRVSSGHGGDFGFVLRMLLHSKKLNCTCGRLVSGVREIAGEGEAACPCWR